MPRSIASRNMSTGQISRQTSRSSAASRPSIHSSSHQSHGSLNTRQTPPPAALTPENVEQELEPCAATASFLLYAQRNLILVLHHDTLAIERRFDLHREDVLWVTVDNTSERGSGRLAVSYDTGNTAIVWDILTGGEVARFSAYEKMKVATFMRNGNIAFGNDQGNIILFEPSTSEHISARTIFDPVTALAPASDCRTFAIGYLNGSILIATLQPSFTILHTLTTARAPSRITGLAWHGSSSKQKTDMLATQTMDGDLRVWSVPKAPHQESPNIIRVLQRNEIQQPGPCWFSWSKTGRIVQYAEGETRSWDVRTKKVTFEVIPTVEGTVGIAAYGPTATLFTLGRNHTVQQYDITPGSAPMLVAGVQHMPSATPPTPPTILDDHKNGYSNEPQTAVSTEAPLLPLYGHESESSADESGVMSPLQKIAHDVDSLEALQSEMRDQVMPLSPTSSRASSISSRSSGARSRRGRKYLYDRPDSSRASSSTGFEGTEFSFGGPPSVRQGHDSMSIRSVSSFQSRPANRSSHLRREVLRSPDEDTVHMDLFPFTKARLREVAFRTPHYGTVARTPELLQREMLSVVFGWSDTVKSLIRDEMTRHRPGSASGVLLAKWLGDVPADDLTSMIGTESMTSSDWMLLALSSIGADSQKKVGEAFVQRLLEKGDVHPAVAILLGLGEHNDAIEVYVSQSFWLEAVLLTCLLFPSDWGRQSFLIRKWGETAVQSGQPELAVRCFSCTSIETTEPWFSPRAQDAVYAAQQVALTGSGPMSAGALSSPPLSPPSRSGSGRLTQKNASLKLITTFGAKGAPAPRSAAGDPTPMVAAATPIAESALSPGGQAPWRASKASSRNARDLSEARTATPGGARRKRLPSKSDIERAKLEASEMATPMTAARDFAPPVPLARGSLHSRRASAASSVPSSVPEPTTAVRPSMIDSISRNGDEGHLPSPAKDAFTRLSQHSRSRSKAEGLAVQVIETAEIPMLAPAIYTGTTNASSAYTTESIIPRIPSPPLTANSAKARAIDRYISSVEEARTAARSRAESRKRAESRRRDGSRAGRASSRVRERSASRGPDVMYIKPAKRSPSSPVPMSPEEFQQAILPIEPATAEDESFYKMISPVESQNSRKSAGFDQARFRRSGSPDRKSGDGPTKRATSRARRSGSPDRNSGEGSTKRAASRARSRTGRDPEHSSAEEGKLRYRGRSSSRNDGSVSPPNQSQFPDHSDTKSEGGHQRFRMRSRSASQRPGEDLQSRRLARKERDRSNSRRPRQDDSEWQNSSSEQPSMDDTASLPAARPRHRALNRKELAAKELEERRLSLARRPSAPAIPMPGELSAGLGRPRMSPRSHTDMGNSPLSHGLSRSQTVDPEAMSRYNQTSGKSVKSNAGGMPAMGLPATPRAMRHPRYMGDPNDPEAAPPVPEIPGNFSELSSLGSSMASSNLSQVTGSVLSQLSSDLTQEIAEADDIGPLLPSTVFGQKGPQGPTRSASAPPEKMSGRGPAVHPLYKAGIPSSSARRLSSSKGGMKRISPQELGMQQYALQNGSNISSNISSIDEALHASESQVMVVADDDEETGPPIMLPELQHLAGPPPPPPPPTMFQQPTDVIDVMVDEHHAQGNSAAMDVLLPATTFSPPLSLPQPMERSTTASPSMHRRGQNSMDGSSFGARFRGVTDRMRSGSRSRANQTSANQDNKPVPYETVLPPVPGHARRGSFSTTMSQGHGHVRRESFSRAKSPYEQAMAQQQAQSFGFNGTSADNMIPPPPPPPPAPPAPGMEGKLHEVSVPPGPSHLPPRSQSAMAGGYRNPREIRANMPPETLQQGVFMGGAGFL